MKVLKKKRKGLGLMGAAESPTKKVESSKLKVAEPVINMVAQLNVAEVVKSNLNVQVS